MMKNLAMAMALVTGIATLSMALAGTAWAEDRVVTITGEVVVEETDADGGRTVRIVTEKETYRVHETSKQTELHRHKGRQIAATGTLEATEVGKSIAVAEYAVLEETSPAVGAK
jgi:hypothetical protein